MVYKLMLVVGVIFLAISIYEFKRTIDFLGKSTRAIGTVTSLEENDGAYSPIFEIEIKNDNPVTYCLPAASNPSAWVVGEKATFLYDPQHPDSPRMMSYFWIFSWSLFFIAIAIPLIIFGSGYFLLNPMLRSNDLNTSRAN
ncbi:DUF3592 domain-containing protein [Chitinophaga silvatica]|uniref:DUF3592 domain-containing protein n=1 Tax=Chitinophaga silvatica TaxID=2282649 RepID=A0A3E1Y9K0_9BACT|nr:DUF3592 domain-containing protein [Chitinophaga silvatica]RFS21866.1 DUF3592 domain-containing protein [Chitinophaga silvatica]